MKASLTVSLTGQDRLAAVSWRPEPAGSGLPARPPCQLIALFLAQLDQVAAILQLGAQGAVAVDRRTPASVAPAWFGARFRRRSTGSGLRTAPSARQTDVGRFPSQNADAARRATFQRRPATACISARVPVILLCATTSRDGEGLPSLACLPAQCRRQQALSSGVVSAAGSWLRPCFRYSFLSSALSGRSTWPSICVVPGCAFSAFLLRRWRQKARPQRCLIRFVASASGFSRCLGLAAGPLARSFFTVALGVWSVLFCGSGLGFFALSRRIRRFAHRRIFSSSSLRLTAVATTTLATTTLGLFALFTGLGFRTIAASSPLSSLPVSGVCWPRLHRLLATAPGDHRAYHAGGETRRRRLHCRRDRRHRPAAVSPSSSPSPRQPALRPRPPRDGFRRLRHRGCDPCPRSSNDPTTDDDGGLSSAPLGRRCSPRRRSRPCLRCRPAGGNAERTVAHSASTIIFTPCWFSSWASSSR